MASGLNHEPNASDGTLIGLQIGLKRSLEACRVALLTELAQSSQLELSQDRISRVNPDLTQPGSDVGCKLVGLLE